VTLTNVAAARAIQLVEQLLVQPRRQTGIVFFANAHTLNLAAADPAYRAVLNQADHVFGDGTGVRWAARARGVRMRDNLNGTDFVPALLRAKAGRNYTYYLLGADNGTIATAAGVAAQQFPGWTQAGFHSGYLQDPATNAAVIEEINRCHPDLLLVGMGNPRQERWIAEHRRRLKVGACLGVGGLFDFWANNVSRAPRWLRRAGHEWIWRLWQQPREKARRYLLGNPLFLARVLRDAVRKGTPEAKNVRALVPPSSCERRN
jgi:N-acetylglucosaminyldiphosphoundecaprenol N-acetyl-beta-D-mannosaminyltransferase